YERAILKLLSLASENRPKCSLYMHPKSLNFDPQKLCRFEITCTMIFIGSLNFNLKFKLQNLIDVRSFTIFSRSANPRTPSTGIDSQCTQHAPTTMQISKQAFA